MFKNLNPLLHSQLRLAIMSLLVSEEKADFNRIKEVTGATWETLAFKFKNWNNLII